MRFIQQYILAAFLALLTAIPAYASDTLDIQSTLSRPGVRLVVVEFYATWCKPCIEELPYFEEFRTKHTNDKVRVILCSLDFPKQIESKLIPFVKKHQLKSDVVVLLDGKFNNWIDKVSDEWSGSLPATYIYQKDRKQFFEKSFKNLDELEQVMQSYL